MFAKLTINLEKATTFFTDAGAYEDMRDFVQWQLPEIWELLNNDAAEQHGADVFRGKSPTGSVDWDNKCYPFDAFNVIENLREQGIKYPDLSDFSPDEWINAARWAAGCDFIGVIYDPFESEYTAYTADAIWIVTANSTLLIDLEREVISVDGRRHSLNADNNPVGRVFRQVVAARNIFDVCEVDSASDSPWYCVGVRPNRFTLEDRLNAKRTIIRYIQELSAAADITLSDILSNRDTQDNELLESEVSRLRSPSQGKSLVESTKCQKWHENLPELVGKSAEERVMNARSCNHGSAVVPAEDKWQGK